jgi:hypothetical protein
LRGSSTAAGELHLSRVVSDAWRLGVRHARFLIAAGACVFVPVGLIEALELDQVQIHDFGVFRLLALLLVAIFFAAATLVGEVLYSGVVAAVAKEDHGWPEQSIGEILRSLPYGRLIAADLVFVAMVTLGLLAFVVPGILVLAWFSLAAVTIEVERGGVLAAFRRSRELVRRHFWRALALMVVVTLLGEGLSAGITSLVATVLGHSFADRWVEATFSSMLTAPVFALPVVALYFALAEFDSPVATSSGTVAKA